MLRHLHLASLNIDYQITNSFFNKCAFMRKQDFENNYPSYGSSNPVVFMTCTTYTPRERLTMQQTVVMPHTSLVHWL